MAHVLAISRAFPPHSYPQHRFTKEIASLLPREGTDFNLLAKIHSRLQVSHRWLSLPLTETARDLKTFTNKNDAYIRIGLELVETAVRKVLVKAGLRAEDVDHVFFVTLTGLSNPSIETRLFNRFLPSEEFDPAKALGPDVGAFKRTVARTSTFGVGCAGGGTIINRATEYLLGHPGKVALTISLELFTLTLQFEDTSFANMVTTGMYGDAAAAMVMVGDRFYERRKAEKIQLNGIHVKDPLAIFEPPKPTLMPKIIAQRGVFYPHTEDLLGWEIGSYGFKMVLSPTTKQVYDENLLNDVLAFLQDTKDEFSDSRSSSPTSSPSIPTTIDEIASLVVYPGGPKLLSIIGDCLSIRPPSSDASINPPLPETEQSLKGLEMAYRCLESVGNCASASVMMILEDTIDTTSTSKKSPFETSHQAMYGGALRRKTLQLKEGDFSLLMAFGPGVCIEMNLIEWHRV